MFAAWRLHCDRALWHTSRLPQVRFTYQGPSLPSRWGYIYTADWRVDTGGQPHEVKEHTLANLRRQVAESLANLDGEMGLYQVGGRGSARIHAMVHTCV